MIAKYFRLEELVDPVTFREKGQDAWSLFPDESILMIDGVREFFGLPVTVNNWLWGGELQFRGYRPDWYTIGAKGSAHRVGKAFDLDVKGWPAQEARRIIMQNKDHSLLRYIQRMERGVDWVHIDTFEPPDERIYLFI